MFKRRSLLMAPVIGLLAMLATTAAGAPAQAAPFPTPINVWNTNNCLDNATENAAKVQVWSCNGGSQQKWTEGFNASTSTFFFMNSRTQLCVAAPAGAGTVTMASCDGSAAEQWQVFFADNPLGPPSGWYDVWENFASGLCLATPSLSNGTVLQTAPCTASSLLQRWHEQ